LLYGQVAAALLASDGAADAVPLFHLRARLAERRGENNDALANLRRIAELAPGDRAALFRLESRARESGLGDEVARWDDAIAAHFEGDPRAQAAFLTRAGEALIDAGRRGVDQAITRFRAAVTAAPGYFPALRAWLRLALVEERWGDVATVCEQQAEVARTDAERAHLYHLAGVTAMERGDDPERAAADLRHVLALDPRHEDAFRRLRKLLVGHGRHADLAELLGQRVEIETEAPRLVELHATLAALFRDALGDPERAKAHLRAVLSRDPRNLAATASLADITWGLGQWGEAAEALIARARLENDPQLLKETFFRLGVIYSDHLPDRRWALKSFERVLGFDPGDLRALEYVSQLAMAGGEWRLALGATERLAGLELPELSVRAGHILRIARIHEEGFADAKRAEESLKRAHELDPTNTEVLAAIVAFYQRRRDLPTLRVHLDRTAGTMRWRLAKSPGDGLAYRTLARALAVRGQLGVVGSLEAARAAAELAHAFGAADETELGLIAEATPPSGRGLGDLGIDEVLFHASIPNGFRQIFRLLYETLGKRFPADVRRFGVGRAERLPRTGHPFRELAGVVAAELGIKDLEVYVGTAQPLALAVEMTDPISLVVGSALVDATKPAQIRFAVGRALKLYASYMALPARLTPDELGVLLAGIIRLYDPQFAPPGVAPAAIAEEAQRLGRLVPKRLRDEVAPFASEIHGQEFDHQALWLGVQHTGNRAGLVTGGSVLAGASVLLRQGRLGDLASGLEDPQIVELLRFAVGDEHCDVRRTLSSP
jgi:cellulose synthase operon protein C